MRTPEEVFPEYYLIRVNEFNKAAVTPLEEWIDYLKNGYVRPDTTTPGLREANEKLNYMQMDSDERRAYEHYLDNLRIEEDCLETAKIEGIEEGREEATVKIARNMKSMGISDDVIAKTTGLSKEEISGI